VSLIESPLGSFIDFAPTKCSGTRPFYTLKLEEEYKQIVDEIYIYLLKKYAIMSNN